ncbi:DUF1990 family protein [Paludisphaera mucosa]|uniref:DUF1990 family protein n=1 Tax=Paludisphaera mucosa TaxID=3030827 RepID=A0ABT6FBT9_9BACT|nr:DUF1990 family protein [Paludisphaera mucosa]MDG3005055.1 DUF1990 family protein [Paludisphaera mucosa]
MSEASIGAEVQDVIHAATGTGPLLQRDYIGAIEGGPCSPEDLAKLVRTHFTEFGPPETAAFQRRGEEHKPLEVGDELSIRLAGIMPCGVRVVQVDPLCLTLRTLCGHPEAGRISFKAGRDDQGRVTLHIRSRARSGGLIHYIGFLVLGRTMQARCWIRFIGRVAEVCGGRLDGPVRVSTSRVDLGAADCGGPDRSTFECEG